MNAALFRTRVRLALDADLVSRIEHQAAERGLPIERYVEEVLADVLPSMVAEASAAYIEQSRKLAARADALDKGVGVG
jgi:hypothetical protein